MKIAIVGGGISGLATAFYLRHQNPEIEVTIFESAPKLGGKMLTQSVGGFQFEEGSNGFLSNKPDTLELVKLAGCDELLMRSNDNARIRFIYKDFLCRLPETPGAFLKTPLLSLWGKLRVAGEFFIAPKKNEDDETLQSFGYRRVGHEMTDVFLDAMVAGIFASKPDKISVNAAFPAVVKLEREYGGLFKGMRAKKKKEAGPGGVLMSFKKGVSSFITKLSEACGAEIFLGKEVKHLEKTSQGYRIQAEGIDMLFDKVILSTPAYVSAKLVEALDMRMSEQLLDIEYSPISVVGLGYDTMQHDLQGFGLLTTTSANVNVLGVLWDSSIFPDRAPQGKKSVRVMIGGQRNPELALRSDAELVSTALDGIKTTMGVTDHPTITYVKRYEKGIPNYGVGHLEKMEALFKRVDAMEGLYLNSNAYYGVGLNDCVGNSKKCAQKVLSEL